MSSLGISILILAVSALMAVLVVNLLQARGRRKRLSAALPKAADAGAVNEGRAEPAAADEGAALPRSAAGAVRGGGASRGARLEPRLGDVEMPVSDDGDFIVHGATAAERDASAAAATVTATPAAAAGVSGGPLLSPVCDCIVTLALDAPVGGERLIALTKGIRRAGAKPMLVDGVPAGADDDEACALVPGVSYRLLRMGVLLANRHGPLNAMEYSEFVSAVQTVADQLSALADSPDMADAIALARDLDSTCAQLDAQIGLNVESPEPLGPAQLSALAAELGLVERGGHRHARLGPDGELVFTMLLDDSPQRICFLLDVPRTAQVHDGWASMLDCAQEAAARLSGRLVDDVGRPIPLESLGTIGRQLAQRYESLEAIGLSAGSPLALRVFN